MGRPRSSAAPTACRPGSATTSTRVASRRPAVEGYLYNRARQAAQRVRLQIQRVDAAGAVVGSSTIWVPGEVPMESRAFFSAAVPEAASYRVQVLSFDWTCQGGGSGM